MASPAPLSRESIVGAALDLTQELGVEKLSIRQVAQRLGVTPMALYKHVENKDELLSLTLDAFISRARVIPDSALPWDRWVETFGRRTYEALRSDAHWTPLLGSIRVGAEAAHVTDAFVEKLCGAGFSPSGAVHAFFAVIQGVIGAVCLSTSMASRQNGNQQGDNNGELSSVTLAYLKSPTIERLKIAPDLEYAAQFEQIEIILPLLITALRQQLEQEISSNSG